MSSEIYYDRAYIRVGDRFIPVVNHGSSNCFDFDACGREVPEKHWSVLNYTFHGRQLFTEEEIRQIAAIYEAANSDNRDGIRKSRNRSFDVGEFGRWIMNGMKTLFVAAAIGNDKQNIERIYGDSFLDITDLNQLPTKLTGVVKRHIRV